MGASTMTFTGMAVSGFFLNLHPSTSLLSALTALLSHDDWIRRSGNSRELSSPPQAKHSLALGKRRNRRHTDAGDDPTFWRADMSVHHHGQPGVVALSEGIKVDQVTSCVVEEADEGNRWPPWRAGTMSAATQPAIGDYFDFDLTALERCKPSNIGPSARSRAQTMPAIAQ